MGRQNSPNNSTPNLHEVSHSNFVVGPRDIPTGGSEADYNKWLNSSSGTRDIDERQTHLSTWRRINWVELVESIG